MKKNNIDIEITGLDFRQDVEPLIKEFFPGFLYDHDVKISVRACDTSFEVCAKKDGQTVSGPGDMCIESENIAFSEGENEKERHRQYRNRLLRALYRVLQKYTGKS